MVAENKKYTAYSYNIAGFALITPIGKIVLEPISTFNEFGLTPFIYYSVVCILLAIIGFCLVIHGRGILDG